MQRDDAEREARRQRENSEQQRAAHTRIWLESEAHRATLLIYGDIPPHIAWRGGLYRHSLDADPTQWHAEIFIRCIYDKPAGTAVTVADAITALAAARIEPVSQPEATRAVEDYIYNLHQRGILGTVNESTFRVAG